MDTMCGQFLSPTPWVVFFSLCLRSCCDVFGCFATSWTVTRQVPLFMGFSRQEYGVGCHFLLQGIFLTQGSNPSLLCLLHRRQILYLLSPWGSPLLLFMVTFHEVLHVSDMKFVYFSFMLGAFLVSVKKMFHYPRNHDHIKLFGWPKCSFGFSISCNGSFWPAQYMSLKNILCSLSHFDIQPT